MNTTANIPANVLGSLDVTCRSCGRIYRKIDLNDSEYDHILCDEGCPSDDCPDNGPKLIADLTVTLQVDGHPEDHIEIIQGEPGGPTVGYLCPDLAEDYVWRINAYDDLLAALEGIELRLTQARIASGIGQPRLKDADFLRRECERIATDARAAITNATNPA